MATAAPETRPAHTPRPWTIDEDAPMDICGPDDRLLASVYPELDPALPSQWLPSSLPIAAATARLIAAAPDLLAALETINRIASPDAERTLIDGVTRDLNYITDIARAAIAKAEGR